MDTTKDKFKLSKYTFEFTNESTETDFLRFSWKDYKVITRNTLLVVSFLFMSFFVRDVLEAKTTGALYILLIVRLSTIFLILMTAYIIHNSTDYFHKCHILLFFNQILIGLAIFALAVVREMPIAYLGVNTILCTLIFYQFVHNRFYYTTTACIFVCMGAIATAALFMELSASEFIASILFLIPLNFLGIIILRSMNRIRRKEYIAMIQLKQADEEKQTAILDLQKSLAEVKTLRGFLPICARCKNIRDDKGYWNRIETYLKNHTNAEFSHGLCPDCQKELYGDQEWFKKLKGDSS